MCKMRGGAFAARRALSRLSISIGSIFSSMPSISSRRPYRIGRSRTGLGLFATRPIKKGDFIIKYWGRRIPNKLADELDNRYLFELNKRWTIDGSPRRNIARYINHSCRPNAETDIIKGEILISAIKNIEPGDEITYDYGKDHFNGFIKPKGCQCDKCREKRRHARNGAGAPTKRRKR
jgi:SET domain-containing protein